MFIREDISKDLEKAALDLMAGWPTGRNKQKAFVLNFVANGFQNAADAALKAGFSAKNARKHGSFMLNNKAKYGHIAEVVAKLQAIFDERAVELSVASCLEIRQFWSDILRGNVKDVKFIGVGEGIQKVIEVSPDLATRLAASDKLAKSYAMYSQNISVNSDPNVNISFLEVERDE
ncbi:terminase small subunit [Gemella sp. zg-1178]|uniref:terminase small subunit n=1 Tax=Gemella sp. zg-1178 TaxID=2840372 RepID=UPI001C053830|nr:terminase small subunit [Gemella sp. zg-1178]